MLQRGLTFTRYVAFVAVVAALAASVALILYQAAVVAEVIVEAVRQGELFPKSGKALAVGFKQIAAEIKTSESTVKVHRTNLMHKMQASSLADLMVMAGRLDLPDKSSKATTD